MFRITLILILCLTNKEWKMAARKTTRKAAKKTTTKSKLNRPAAKKSPAKKAAKKAAPRRRGRPAENKPKPYTTVLRLPLPLANKLKKAAKKNEISINKALETVIGVWVKSEGF